MMKRLKQIPRLIVLMIIISLTLQLTACVKKRPRDTDNICSIFKEYPVWYWDTMDVQKKWGVPIYVTMSIIYQESHFNARAQPPKRKLLWIIPWFRPSSSFGYSQAVNRTWRRYQKDSGRRGATRDAFGDATDFIGWYANEAHQKAGVSRHDAYRVYLSYHEGISGYQRRSYLRKQWLLAVARNVDRRAYTYRMQLEQCEDTLPRKSWYRFW